MEDNNTNKTNTTKTTKKDMEIAALKEEIAELKKMLTAPMVELKEVAPSASAPQLVNIITPTTDVVLVYCSDSLGHLATAHVELDFSRWGEEFTLTRSQFDEVVGKYRAWFDEGILAVSGNTEDGIRIAAAKGIRTHNEFYLDKDKLNSIGKMSSGQIENLWENTRLPKHRESIVTFVKRKFIEGDPAYHNREKIDLFNRLTDGSFTREQDELSGRTKIEAKNLNKV